MTTHPSLFTRLRRTALIVACGALLLAGWALAATTSGPGDHGTSIDPHGVAQSGDHGTSIDPHGVAQSGDHGTSIDPHGVAQSGDHGTSIDPHGVA